MPACHWALAPPRIGRWRLLVGYPVPSNARRPLRDLTASARARYRRTRLRLSRCASLSHFHLGSLCSAGRVCCLVSLVPSACVSGPDCVYRSGGGGDGSDQGGDLGVGRPSSPRKHSAPLISPCQHRAVAHAEQSGALPAAGPHAEPLILEQQPLETSPLVRASPKHPKASLLPSH